MTTPTPAPASPGKEEEAVGIAVVLGREIKMKRMTPDQLLAADMMARRLQRMNRMQDGADSQMTDAEWQKFLGGTRRLLDWVSGQFYNEEDLDWFEDRMLAREVSLQDIAPLLLAMGMPQSDEPKKVVRKARSAK